MSVCTVTPGSGMAQICELPCSLQGTGVQAGVHVSS
jgi:hypothetical protein